MASTMQMLVGKVRKTSAAPSSSRAATTATSPRSAKKRKTLLVVGSTQNGKSTFCNFMYHGKMYEETEIFFPIGSGQRSETKAPQAGSFDYGYTVQKPNADGTARLIEKEVTYTIVDTPGIGDTSEVDEESNLKQLYAKLIEMAERGDVLSGIIICSRFGSLQNEEYTRNVKFYREMFRDVFNSNVIIVITNVDHTNPRWVRQKQMCGQTWEQQLATQTHWIQETLGLTSGEAMVAYLDAMPFDEEAGEHCMRVRNLVLQHCAKTKVDIKKITFAKALPLRARDGAKQANLRGKIEGIMEGIRITDAQNGEIALKINAQTSSIEGLKERIKESEEELRQLDTEADYSLGTHRYEDGWHILTRASARFEIRKQHPITKLNVSQGWVELESPLDGESKEARGQVKNQLWKSLSSTLTCYTTNQLFYASTIKQLRDSMTEHGYRQRQEETDLDAYRQANTQNNRVLDEFSKQMKELNEEIAKLNRTTMTYEEAVLEYCRPKGTAASSSGQAED